MLDETAAKHLAILGLAQDLSCVWLYFPTLSVDDWLGQPALEYAHAVYGVRRSHVMAAPLSLYAVCKFYWIVYMYILPLSDVCRSFIVVPISVSPFSEKMIVPSSDLEPEFAKKYAGKMLNFSKGL